MSKVIRLPQLSKTTRIGVVGLGYVGLPLAVEFGKQFATIGFDIAEGRIQELRPLVRGTETGQCNMSKFIRICGGSENGLESVGFMRES